MLHIYHYSFLTNGFEETSNNNNNNHNSNFDIWNWKAKKNIKKTTFWLIIKIFTWSQTKSKKCI